MANLQAELEVIERSTRALLTRILGEVSPGLTGSTAAARQRRFDIAVKDLSLRTKERISVSSISRRLAARRVPGMQQPNISAWLRGRRKQQLSQTQLEELARELSLHPAWLADGDVKFAPTSAFIISDAVLNTARWVATFLSSITEEDVVEPNLLSSHDAYAIEDMITAVYKNWTIDHDAFARIARATRVRTPLMLTWQERRILKLGLSKMRARGQQGQRMLASLHARLAASLIGLAEGRDEGLGTIERRLLSGQLRR